MAALTSVLTWAIPLNYDELIPKLRAYAKIKPVADELRRCIQSTEKAPITTLPTEVVDIVVQNLLADTTNNEEEQ